MSRRPLSLVVVVLASLVVAACSDSPTAPQSGIRPSAASFDSVTTARDTTSRTGWSGSNG